MRWTIALAALGALVGAPCAAQAETLDDAIARALARDPELAAQKTNLESARAARQAAFAQFFPVFGASVSRGSSWSNGTTFNSNTSSVEPAGGNESGSAGVDVTQTLFSSGALLSNFAAARADEQRAIAVYRAQEDALILRVVQAYVGVLYAEQAVTIETQDVERLLREVDAATVRFEAGAATKTDVYQAQTALASAQADLASAKADLASQRATYYRRVGDLPGTLESPPLPETPADIDIAISDARAHAPDIAAAEAALRGAQQRKRNAYSDYFPSLTVSGSAQRRGSDGFDDFDNDSATATLRLSIPIWSGGRTTAAVRQAKAAERGARYSVDNSVRATDEVVTQNWARFDAAKQRIVASTAQLEAASFAARGAELERREGLRTQLELLEQLSNENTAALALAAANRDAIVASYQLLQSIGAVPRPDGSAQAK